MTQADWTVMVYLAGENSLSPNAFADIGELRQVGSSASVNFVVQHDSLYEPPARYRVETVEAHEQRDILAPVDSGDPRTLLDFVTWAHDRWPARRYALILWSHGSGWDQTEISAIARAAAPPDFDPAESVRRSESPLRKIVFRSTLKRIAALPTRAQRAVCVDDATGHSLDTVELGKVLAAIGVALGQPLDLLGLDACLMANLEVAYEVAASARVLVASEAPEPDTGWPYQDVARIFNASPSAPALQVAAAVVAAFGDAAVRMGQPKTSTLVALDLARIGEVADAADALAAAFLATAPKANQTLWSAHTRARRFWGDTLADLDGLSAGLERQTSPAALALKVAATKLRQRLSPGGAVLASVALGKDVAGVGGVSIYLPVPRLAAMSAFYAETAFARERRWPALIRAYLGIP